MTAHTDHDAAAPNQFALLRQRRFAPFFWTQFLGAGNDNLFKFAFTVMATYQLQVAWLPPALAGLVIGALFILPFVLFSATSGQLADKLEKSRLMRWVKDLEIAVMLVAAVGFLIPSPALLLACVALMGLHSTLFGPVKFAYLPQHLAERELTGGNGMVEMGTFVAILLGSLAGGLLIALPGVGATAVALGCVGAALLGRWVAQRVPLSPATDPALRINWNPLTETWRNLRLARENSVVFRSLLGISWMWFFGAVFLANFPIFAKQVLHGDEQVASLLLVVFSIGIGTGALLCERLSRRHVEIGLVPLGAIGMTVFAVDLYFASRGLPALATQTATQTAAHFITQPAHWRVMADLALLALSAGLYSVPMYALIQLRCPPTHRARIIAANNILNALFMIVSSLGAGLMLSAGLSIPEVFLATGLLNVAVALYVFLRVPEYLLRFVVFLLSRLLYRVTVTGDQHLPAAGAAIVVCNHVSTIDALLLMAASPRAMRLLIDPRRFAVPVLGWLLRRARAIPLVPPDVDPVAHAAALDAADRALAAGELLGLFAAGGATRDDGLQAVAPGVMVILARRPVPVVPVALQSLGSAYFSRSGAAPGVDRPLRRAWFSHVGVAIGPALAPDQVSPEVLRSRVQALLGAG